MSSSSNQKGASKDPGHLDDDDDFNYIEVYLNSFPDELDMYRRNGCQFIRSKEIKQQ